MMAFQHLARRAVLPGAAAAYLAANRDERYGTRCDVAPQETETQTNNNGVAPKLETKTTPKKSNPVLKAGMRPEEEGYYYDLFPKRQLFQPKVEYPMWHRNWDKREPETKDMLAKVQKYNRKHGVSRHIILIRHGQYDEQHKEDHKRLLTPLGREQADLTGKRIAEMIKGVDEEFGPCNVKVLRVSDLARAKETADIIAAHLPDVKRSDPDPLLNEGRPAHHIPCKNVSERTIESTDQGHSRIEKAFQKYFHRAPYTEVEEVETHDSPNEDGELKPQPKHEFEIIVCHANVIRYFCCRGLQIPPEAWLRLCTFNCSLTYLTIRPSGTVSCRMLGDIGHLPYSASTFSSHHGFNW